MDVTLPGGDGLDATRRIRALAGEAGRLPVIGISGLSSPEEEARARAAGMADYLAKPLSPARLAKAIAAAVGARVEGPRRASFRNDAEGAAR
jgi:CheY-like chemotaxis protein